MRFGQGALTNTDIILYIVHIGLTLESRFTAYFPETCELYLTEIFRKMYRKLVSNVKGNTPLEVSVGGYQLIEPASTHQLALGITLIF